jgi:predicted deacetylase
MKLEPTPSEQRPSGGEPRAAPLLFHLSVHDLAAPFRREVELVCREVRALVGDRFSVAVTPRWAGEPLEPSRDGWLLDAAEGAEVLLHGLTHRAPGPSGAIGWLTGGMNELGGLPLSRALARLEEAQARLLALGLRPVGSVAPGWDHGALRPRDLATLGLGFAADLFGVATPFRRVALATRSWDNGRFGALALLGEALGAVIERVHPAAVPQIVLHPLDVRRGWLDRGLACVRRLLDRGARPATLGRIVAEGAGC